MTIASIAQQWTALELILGVAVFIAAVALVGWVLSCFSSYCKSTTSVDNRVTRAGDALLPFVKACSDGKIEAMAHEYLSAADRKGRIDKALACLSTDQSRELFLGLCEQFPEGHIFWDGEHEEYAELATDHLSVQVYSTGSVKIS